MAKRKKPSDYKVTAERLAVLIEAPETPDYVRESVFEMLIDLEERTQVNLLDPDYIRVVFPLIAAAAEPLEISVDSRGMLTKEQRRQYELKVKGGAA